MLVCGFSVRWRSGSPWGLLHGHHTIACVVWHRPLQRASVSLTITCCGGVKPLVLDLDTFSCSGPLQLRGCSGPVLGRIRNECGVWLVSWLASGRCIGHTTVFVQAWGVRISCQTWSTFHKVSLLWIYGVLAPCSIEYMYVCMFH